MKQTNNINYVLGYIKRLEKIINSPLQENAEIHLNLSKEQTSIIKFNPKAYNSIATHISIINTSMQKKINDKKHHAQKIELDTIFSKIKQMKKNLRIKSEQEQKTRQKIQELHNAPSFIINDDYYFDFSTQEDQYCQKMLAKVEDTLKEKNDLNLFAKYVSTYKKQLLDDNKKNIELTIDFTRQNTYKINIQKNFKFTLFTHSQGLERVCIHILNRLVRKYEYHSEKRQLMRETKIALDSIRSHSILLATKNLKKAYLDTENYRQIAEKYFPTAPPLKIGKPLPEQALTDLRKMEEIHNKKIKEYYNSIEQKPKRSSRNQIIRTIASILHLDTTLDDDIILNNIITVGLFASVFCLGCYTIYQYFKLKNKQKSFFENKTLLQEHSLGFIENVINENQITAHGEKVPETDYIKLFILIMTILILLFMAIEQRRR